MELMGGVFNYANPKTIHWGAHSIEHLRDELDKLEASRPFLVTARSIANNAALMSRLVKAANRELAGRHTIGQHTPERDLDEAQQAATMASADALISFGGGSAIDAAKVVALRLGQARNGQPLPHVAVPTTLSVAELSSSAGITDAQGRKGGLSDKQLLPSAVIYDGEIALHTPLDLWLSTGIRALDHAVETILELGEHPYADTLSLEAIRRLFASLPAAKARPGAVAVRTENQLAAWFSYSLPACARGLSHVMGKQIGARHGIPHGVTSCLLLPHVMRYRARTQADRLALMASAMGVDRAHAFSEELASAATGAVYGLIRQLGLPQHLSAYKLSEEQLRAAAKGPGPNYPPADAVLAIYHAAA